MFIMKGKLVCLFALCLCLLMGCTSVNQEFTESPTIETTVASAELKMPESMKDLAENPDVQWMAGMLAVLDDVEMVSGISQDSFEIFTDPGDVIRATITAQNGLDLSQRFDLMVFADGVPMEFEVEGKLYRTYPMVLTQQQICVQLEFRKNFALNIGRLDFFLSLAENNRADSHMLAYTMWIDIDGEAVTPDTLFTVVDQRTGLRGTHTGGAYHSWIWNEGYFPIETDYTGPRALSIQNGETVLLEVIAAKEGMYRTVLVVNGTPSDFEVNGNRCTYVDWASTGTNMLQLPITLNDLPSSGCIYTITTPLTTEERAQFLLASGKVEFLADVEE